MWSSNFLNVCSSLVEIFDLTHIIPLESSNHTQGKRKRQEEMVPSDDFFRPNTSLEHRISQHESKKAGKRRRKAERLALEQQRQQQKTDHSIAFLPVRPLSLPSQRLDMEFRGSEQLSLNKTTRRPDVEDVIFYDGFSGQSRLPAIPSVSSSDWVFSMLMAGGSKTVETASQQLPSTSPYIATSPASTPPSPEILPPIRIDTDLSMTTEQTIQTQTQTQTSSQTIGMKPEQDPNTKHGIFHVNESTIEAGTTQKKRKSQYIPNPARTLVMEQLPKTHRTITFVGSWCLSACGVPALHIFVDPPSAKALIEFPTADLARKAWASPRLGQNLLGVKSHLLKGKAREDLIKVWWYRLDGIGAGASVGELEEGEIEEDVSIVREAHLPLAPEPPRKETKSEKRARLAKEREQKMVKEMQQKLQQLQPQDKETIVGSSASFSSVSPGERTESLQVQSLPIPLPTALSQSALPSFPKVHMLPPAVQKPFELPMPQPWQYTAPTSIPQPQPQHSIYIPSLKQAVGASLLPSSRGGHDDSDSIASSDGRSSPYPMQAKITSAARSSKVVIASVIGQADDLADYEEVEIDADMQSDRREEVGTCAIPPATPTSVAAQTSLFKESEAPNSIKGPSVELLQTAVGRQFTTDSKVNGTVELKVPYIQQDQLRFQSRHDSDLIRKNVPELKISTSTNPSSALDTLSSGRTTTNYVPSILHVKQEARAKQPLPTRLGVSTVASDTVMKPPDATSLMTSFSQPLAPINCKDLKSSDIDSEGRVIEENLRQLVFASKKRPKAAEPYLPKCPLNGDSAIGTATKPMQFGRDHIQSEKAVTAVSSDSSPSIPSTPTIPPPRSSSAEIDATSENFSFEELAISFITQTIENIKAKPQDQQDQPTESSFSNIASSTSTTPPLVPATGLLAPLTAVTNTSNSVVSAKPLRLNVVSELAAKKKRLEEHIQESKGLMERISTAKTKQEKDLLFKIMREKNRYVSFLSN